MLGNLDFCCKSACLPSSPQVPQSLAMAVGRQSGLKCGAETSTVSSVAGIQNALLAAQPNDVIKVSPGSYDIGTVTIPPSASLCAEPETVDLIGTSRVLMRQGSTLEGFVFREGWNEGDYTFGNGSVEVERENACVSQCHWITYGVNEGSFGRAISIFPSAINAEVLNCEFEDMWGISIFVVQDLLVNVVTNAHIHHNYYHNNPSRTYDSGISNAGGEALVDGIAFSDGHMDPAQLNDNLSTLFEYNRLDDHWAEGELISDKSEGGVYRYNYFSNCRNGHINNRMSLGSLIYGNWMENATDRGGRVSGRNNYWVYNYFGSQNNDTAFLLHHEQLDGSQPNLTHAYWAAEDNIFAKNILDGFTSMSAGIAPGTIVSDPKRNLFDSNVLRGSTTPPLYDPRTISESAFLSQGNEFKRNQVLDSSTCDFFQIGGAYPLPGGESLALPFWWEF